MQEKRLSVFFDKIEPLLILCAGLLLIVKNTMISAVFPTKIRSVLTILEACAILVLFLALSRAALRRKLPAVSVVLLLFLLWYCVCRIPNGVLIQEIKRKEIFYLKLIAFFNIGILLTFGKRKKLLDIAVPVFCSILCLLGILGIYLALSGKGTLTVWNSRIMLQSESQRTGVLRYVEFLGFHRNRSSLLFAIALGLALYGFLSKRAVPLKALFLVMACVLYITIALQHCRSTYVSTSVGFGMLAGICLLDRLKSKKTWLKWVCVPIVTVAIALCSYFGFSVCNTVINKLSAPLETEAAYTAEAEAGSETLQADPEAENGSDITARENAEEDTAGSPDENLRDERSFINDMRTFTSRTKIWKWTLKTIGKKPAILLTGLPENEIVSTVRAATGAKRAFSHLHSAFLQMLMLSGIPGVLLFVLFLVLWEIQAVKMFFGNKPVAFKVLIITCEILLVSALIEPLFSSYANYASCLFMFIAGIVYAGASEPALNETSGVSERSLY